MNELPIFLQIKILIYVTDDIFLLMNQVNHGFNDIISNKLDKEHGDLTEFLYKERSEYSFTDHLLSLKELDEITSWREFYIRILKLKYFMRDINLNNYFIEHDDMNKLSVHVKEGHILEMDILYNLYNLKPNEQDLVVYLRSDKISEERKLKILNWLVYKNIFNFGHEFNNVVRRREYKIVKWYLNQYKNYKYDLHIDFNILVKTDNYFVLNLLITEDYKPKEEVFRYYNNMNMLLYLEKLFPKFDHSIYCPSFVNVEILDYLEKKGLVASRYYLPGYLESFNIDSNFVTVLDWFEKRGILPEKNTYIYVPRTVYLWLQERDLIGPKKANYNTAIGMYRTY